MGMGMGMGMGMVQGIPSSVSLRRPVCIAHCGPSRLVHSAESIECVGRTLSSSTDFEPKAYTMWPNNWDGDGDGDGNSDGDGDGDGESSVYQFLRLDECNAKSVVK